MIPDFEFYTFEKPNTRPPLNSLMASEKKYGKLAGVY